jgi:GT2 family glycosyltransferase
MPCVDIVIVNWNGCKFLGPCLDALAHQTFTDFQVWLVDNGSTDGSLELLRAQYPQVHLICNSHNRGFAAANNQGIRAGNAKYIATLNNDTLADAGWLEALVRVLDENPRTGMAASMMLFADRPEMINSAGIAIDRAGIAWDLRGGELMHPNDVHPTPVFGACAGAALYRRAMLDEIGLFDEDFFAYLEDVDLAWRAQRAGWQALSVPQARVLHYHSATGGEGSPFKNRLLGRNKVWLIAKNYPAPYLWFYLPLIIGYDVAAVMYALLARREGSALVGRLLGIRGMRRMWAERRMLVRHVTPNEMLKKLLPVEPLWLVLSRYRHLRSNKNQR